MSQSNLRDFDDLIHFSVPIPVIYTTMSRASRCIVWSRGVTLASDIRVFYKAWIVPRPARYTSNSGDWSDDDIWNYRSLL